MLNCKYFVYEFVKMRIKILFESQPRTDWNKTVVTNNNNTENTQ